MDAEKDVAHPSPTRDVDFETEEDVTVLYMRQKQQEIDRLVHISHLVAQLGLTLGVGQTTSDPLQIPVSADTSARNGMCPLPLPPGFVSHECTNTADFWLLAIHSTIARMHAVAMSEHIVSEPIVPMD